MLIATLIILAILTVSVASFYRALIPGYRSVYQSASWQEALHGAEAGADYALQTLNGYAAGTPDPSAYTWSGTTTANTSYTPLSAASNRERTLNTLPQLGGPNNVKLLNVGIDVYTRDTTIQNNPWYRIRSTARADLPDKYVSRDGREAELRRMKLTNKNGTLDDPYVARTVEMIVRPKFRFSRAITTVDSLSLGNSNNWLVDSFDSTDTSKSDPGTIAGGIYPASTPSEIQSNGSVATLAVLPTGTLYGPLISANGAIVKGDAMTVGGDNPSTTVHENVSGSSGIDQTRIRDDFDEYLPPVTMPSWSSWSANPPGNTNFTTSTNRASPARYILTTLGAFNVVAPAAGTTGYIELRVDGNLNIGNGNGAQITIPPNVYATIYVGGNINFGNGLVNSNSSSSKVATRLTVYGVGTSRTYVASGNAVQILSFYGPNYGITLNGTVTTVGSMVGRSFSISGGGIGGFHYDEALGKTGAISGWTPVSYFEDTRADVK